jgi:trans-2,3-dihydro-3-hydroxyanthranilate isomerase
MKNLQFYILDVFAEKKYAGNQLAVVRGGAALTDQEMQQIAKEMNYSETTFIMTDEEKSGGYDVRIFTPEEEVPFAGHPTLGTAYVIQKEIIKSQAEEVVLNLKVGQIPVYLEYKEGEVSMGWMKQMPPTFGPTFEAGDLAEILQIGPSDIDERFPIQEVSTGLASLIVPLKCLDVVKKCKIHRDKYFSFVEQIQSKAILVFAPETYNPENQLNARVFVDFFGIPEDSATGSANGCLAGYLVKHKYFNDQEINIQVEQGYEIKRPSLLYLKAKETNAPIDVFIGGKAIFVASGYLL